MVERLQKLRPGQTCRFFWARARIFMANQKITGSGVALVESWAI
jgi:hypothetical protein